MTLRLAGSIASEFIAMLASKSPTGVQDAPASVVFHTPPATPPAYMMFELAGLIIRARVRPPIFPGPNCDHAPSAESEGEGAPALFCDKNLFSRVEYRGIRFI